MKAIAEVFKLLNTDNCRSRKERAVLIFDGDYPMAHGALGLNRDLTLPLDELRAADANPSNIPFGCLPEMRRGGVYCALMKIAARRMRKGSILPGYRGKEVVYAAGKGQLALYRGLESTGEAVVVTAAGQLRELAGQLSSGKGTPGCWSAS